MSEQKIPNWAKPIIRSHREIYKTNHGVDWPGTDQLLFDIYQSESGVYSKEKEIKWIQDNMRNWEIEWIEALQETVIKH